MQLVLRVLTQRGRGERGETKISASAKERSITLHYTDSDSSGHYQAHFQTPSQRRADREAYAGEMCAARPPRHSRRVRECEMEITKMSSR